MGIVACVIPSYNEAAFIKGVVSAIPETVNYIIVVNDASTDETHEILKEIADPRLILIEHEENRGVGAAVVSGYTKALELGADITVKFDGDGQMNAAEINRLIAPILEGSADYCKGVRFRTMEVVKEMPRARLVGNLGLSFLLKAASGYWNIFDPTNGFTAIGRRALELLKLERLHRGFFFESDMLINLYLIDAVVVDVPTSVRYGDEASHLKLSSVLFSFPLLMIRGAFKRILWRYFIRDFTAFSAFFMFGAALFMSGFALGLTRWAYAVLSQSPTPIGYVVLSALLLILGFQLLLQAAVLDIHNVPKKTIQGRSAGDAQCGGRPLAATQGGPRGFK